MQTATLNQGSAGFDKCLVGTLETWPLIDIILWLHETRRSAMLRVGNGLGAGVLFFREGELYRCEWAPHVGEHALILLLQVAAGSFSLIQRDPPEAQSNIHRRTAELLLQITVAQDERRCAVHA